MAATSCSQTTRVAGYQNHKRERSHLITVTYRDADSRFKPDSFPPPPEATAVNRPSIPRTWHRDMDPTERARLYLTRVPPAISGDHGDLHTFRVCCRIVRGFDLDDAGALLALAEWNARCVPPWDERELVAKIAHARKYGREPVGDLRSRVSTANGATSAGGRDG